MRKLLCLAGLLATAGSSTAQVSAQALDSLKALYPFLSVNRNAVVNGEQGLRRFYQKLQRLPGQPNGRVAVVHIGDSHIQADLLTGPLRRALQARFGNAGRGLIFPLAVARTNEGTGYRTASTARWFSRRLLSAPDSILPIGLSGISLSTTDSGASFTLKVPADYRFRRLTLLHAKNPAAFTWRVTDERLRPLRTLPDQGRRVDGYSSAWVADSLLGFARLTAQRNYPWQTYGRLYGLLLENEAPGLLYHAIGINGAAVRHYNRAALFAEQLEALAPDLFIISLGTNDAYSAGFDAEAFGLELAALLQELRRRYPQADFLLTTPPDSYRARRYRNPDLAAVRDSVMRYCQSNNLAYWDFYAVMGGPGAMAVWQQHGLAQADRVHFTARGYQLQARLLYLALLDGFPRAARP